MGEHTFIFQHNPRLC